LSVKELLISVLVWLRPEPDQHTLSCLHIKLDL